MGVGAHGEVLDGREKPAEAEPYRFSTSVPTEEEARACVEAVTSENTHARTHAQTHAHIHTYIHTYTRARTNKHTHTRARAHTYTHTHTHTNEQMYNALDPKP